MMRPYTLFHAGMLGFAAALFFSGAAAEPWRISLSFAVPTLGWLAGLYAGDYYDRDLDAIAKPHRPVPSGRVGAREALAFMVGYIGVGYTLALVLSPLALFLAVMTTVAGIAYSKTFKRRVMLGNLDRGVLAAFTVLFAGAAVGGLDAGLGLLLLVGLFFFHDSASNLVGAIRDLEGDREAGYTTAPVVYGIPRSIRVAGCLSLAWALFALPLFLIYAQKWVSFLLFSLALALAGGTIALLFHKGKTLTRRQALGAHKVLVHERLVLSAGVATIYGPVAIVLVVLVLVAVATQVSQAVLRSRYEFSPVNAGEG